MSQKFGLEEFSRLTNKVKLKRGDNRVIKMVLAVTGVPNTINEEAQELISKCKERCTTLQGGIDLARDTNKKRDEEVRVTIDKMRKEREADSVSISKRITDYANEQSEKQSEIKRLEKILSQLS